MSGTPEGYHEDDDMATKHHLWMQSEATRQRFQHLEARIDENFEEFRHNHASTQSAIGKLRQECTTINEALADNKGVMETMRHQLAQLLIRTNDRRSNSRRHSRSNQDPEAHDARQHAPRRSESRPPSDQGSINNDPHPRASRHGSQRDPPPRTSHQG